MKVHKHQTAIILLLGALLPLQGCSWMSRQPSTLDNSLIEAMQKPAVVLNAAQQQQQIPLRIHYELKQKPSRNQKLAITLEIKPIVDLAAGAYAVKLPEDLKIVEPLGVVNLGGLKANGIYNESVWITPVSEGLYNVEIFIAARVVGKEPQVKMVSIPISIGPFQSNREDLQ